MGGATNKYIHTIYLYTFELTSNLSNFTTFTVLSLLCYINLITAIDSYEVTVTTSFVHSKDLKGNTNAE